MIELFGVVMTISAYIIWFVIKPVTIGIAHLIVYIRHIIIVLLDFIIRIIILFIVLGGAFFGAILLINPENIVFLQTLGISIDDKIMSSDLIILNALALLVGLSILAIKIAQYFFKRPFKNGCGFLSDIFDLCQN